MNVIRSFQRLEAEPKLVILAEYLAAKINKKKHHTVQKCMKLVHELLYRGRLSLFFSITNIKRRKKNGRFDVKMCSKIY